MRRITLLNLYNGFGLSLVAPFEKKMDGSPAKIVDAQYNKYESYAQWQSAESPGN